MFQFSAGFLSLYLRNHLIRLAFTREAEQVLEGHDLDGSRPQISQFGRHLDGAGRFATLG